MSYGEQCKICPIFPINLRIIDEIGQMDRYLLPKEHIREIMVKGVHNPVKHVILGTGTNLRQNRWNGSEFMYKKPPGHYNKVSGIKIMSNFMYTYQFQR